MTEEEAKSKWCPMWRIGKSADVGSHVAVNNHDAAKCIGSDCMMWRNHGTVSLTEEELLEGVDIKYGYCGLSGKP